MPQVVMIGPSMDEVLASLQYLRDERLAGHSTWRTFWGLKATAPDGALHAAKK